MKYLTGDSRWVTFCPKFSNSLYLDQAGQFDERPQIVTGITQLLVLLAMPVLLVYSIYYLFLIPFIFFGWGELYISLPVRTGIQSWSSASWGFTYHSDTVWIYVGGDDRGKSCKTIKMPWHSFWVRTSTKLKNGNWFHETIDRELDFMNEDIIAVGGYGWLEKNKYVEVHPFLDKYNNTTVTATVSIIKREWRFYWPVLTKLFVNNVLTIMVEFDEEVGKNKGSWEGGFVSCKYKLRKDESVLNCLKRLESKQPF